MYRRYSQRGEGSMPLSQMNRNRIKNVIIFVLLAALAALAIISLPMIRDQGTNRTQYIQAIQNECKDAVNDASGLSRTAGADSAAVLSRIRCNIHAIRTLNRVSNAVGNGMLLPDSKLLTLLEDVDSYMKYLSMGMDTGSYSTNLMTELTELQEMIASLN